MDTSILEWVTASGATVTALATIALAWIAHKTLTEAGNQLKHLKNDSQRQTRPYVYLEIVPGLQGNGAWDLRIKNLGASLARDVRIDAGQLSPQNDDDRVVGPLTDFFEQPLTLPPSAAIRITWRRDDPSRTLLEGAPESVTTTISYLGPDNEQYSETYVLSTTAWGMAMPAPQEGSRRTSGENKELADISFAIRALNTHLGELRR